MRTNPLADLIQSQIHGDGRRADRIAAAVRAAGYLGPEDIAAALDAEEDWQSQCVDELASVQSVLAVRRLRTALLGTEEAPCAST